MPVTSVSIAIAQGVDGTLLERSSDSLSASVRGASLVLPAPEPLEGTDALGVGVGVAVAPTTVKVALAEQVVPAVATTVVLPASVASGVRLSWNIPVLSLCTVNWSGVAPASSIEMAMLVDAGNPDPTISSGVPTFTVVGALSTQVAAATGATESEIKMPSHKPATDVIRGRPAFIEWILHADGHATPIVPLRRPTSAS
jgi:hypothetical protein